VEPYSYGQYADVAPHNFLPYHSVRNSPFKPPQKALYTLPIPRIPIHTNILSTRPDGFPPPQRKKRSYTHLAASDPFPACSFRRLHVFSSLHLRLIVERYPHPFAFQRHSSSLALRRIPSSYSYGFGRWCCALRARSYVLHSVTQLACDIDFCAQTGRQAEEVDPDG
jgi:hypothetical protein